MKSGSGSDGRQVATPLGTVREVSAESVARKLAGGEPLVLVDVREPDEFSGPLGHIPGARLVPLGTLGARLGELVAQAGQPIVFVCRSGARSLTAAAIARRAGLRDVSSMEGGMLAWNALN